MDPGSTLNLIPDRLVGKMNMFRFPGTSIYVVLVNREKIQLLGYTKFLYTVAGVQKALEAYIVPGNTTYLMILGRLWMREVGAIGLYAFDEYWIKMTLGLQMWTVCPGPLRSRTRSMVAMQAVTHANLLLRVLDTMLWYGTQYSVLGHRSFSQAAQEGIVSNKSRAHSI